MEGEKESVSVYAKVCARWVPRQLTDVYKQARFKNCLKLLECHSSLILLHFNPE